jgi:hypothetical protein
MHRRIATSALSLLLASAIVLAPMRGALAASDDATITVWTRDGATYRGEIVERVPNDHVTIKLATGETKRFEWKDLDHDSLGDRPAREPAETPPKQERRAGPRVHLEADHADAVLERDVGSASDASGGETRRLFEVVCRAPCDSTIPAGSGYRVSGPGRRPSDTFSLTGAGDHAIRASNGSAAAFKFGGQFALYGTMPLLLGSVLSALPVGDPPDGTLASIRRGGHVILGVGIGMIVVGIVFLVANRNSVDVDGESVARAKPRSTTFALTPSGFVF